MKKDLKTLALMGLGGILMTQAQAHAGQQNNDNRYYMADSMDSMQNSSKKMTESDLIQKLNPETRLVFQSLDKEGKDLALKLAEQACKGKNSCKGMNSCKSKDNTCAGTGGCKGQSAAPFTNKNMAVMLAAKNMAEKRLKSMANGNN